MKNKILSLVLAVLCVMMAIPFTALQASAAEYTVRTLAPEKLTGFEAPYGGGNGNPNYTLHGLNAEITEFDGVPVKAYSKDANAEKITASRVVTVKNEQGEEVKETQFNPNYQLNLYNFFNALDDSDGKVIRAYDSQYVSVEYYYDTTGRDESDENGQDLTNNKIAFDFLRNIVPNGQGNDATDKKCYWTNLQLTASESIVANEWATAVFNYKDALNGQPAGWFEYPSDDYKLGQWKFYPFGRGTGIQMYHGDVFYIKSITFTSFDPAETPSNERTIVFYADEFSKDDGYDPIITMTANDLDTITLPEYPAEYLPEDVVFSGWMESVSQQVYRAGSSFDVNTGMDLEFCGVFAYPSVAYYSASGLIDGVDDTVYTDMQEAIDYIAANGGIGTVIVDGDYNAPVVKNSKNNELKINCSYLEIKGHTPEARFVFNYSNGNSVIQGSDATLVIDDMVVARAAATYDEQFITLDGVTLHFGSGCTFEKGSLNGAEPKLKIYITQTNGFKNGYGVILDSPNINVSQFAPIGTYSNGGYNNTGDYSFVINNGNISGLFAVSRNGNDDVAEKSKINGNVDIVVNGGDVVTLGTANHRSGVDLTGNAFVTINGGTFGQIIFGDEGRSKKDFSTIMGGMALVVNAKTITENGYALPATIKDGNPVSTNKGVFVLNNAELYGDERPNITNAQYSVFVEGGTAIPDLSGNTVKFKITSDDPSLKYVTANGGFINPENGLYTLNKGTSVITFTDTVDEVFEVTYKDGENTVSGGFYTEGGSVNLSKTAFNKTGYYISGYKYGDTTYSVDEVFTMPAENVVFEVVWAELVDNARFVSKNGSSTNNGYTSATPLASLNDAIKSLGGKAGKIVVMDDIDQYLNVGFITGTEPIIVTGKDPYTGEIYENASVAHGAEAGHRPEITGNLTLEYIDDYNKYNNAQNVPFIIKGDGRLTIGEGYEFYVNSNGKKLSSLQVNISGNPANPVVNINSFIDRAQIFDWGNNTISGDLNVNIGSNARFSSGGGMIVGGDAGTSNVVTGTVNGKIYITVSDNQNNCNVVLGGVKAKSKTVINGIQILLKNTNAVVKNHSAGEYINNGATYIVSVPQIPEGAAVEKSDEFGKVNVTIPTGAKVIVTAEDGTKQTYSESGKIALPEGNSSIFFASDAEIIVRYDDGVVENYNGGEAMKFPTRDVVDDKVLYYWTMNGQHYFPGDTFTFPSTSGEYDVAGVRVAKDAVVYIDVKNGDDSNDGLTSETALKSKLVVEKALAAFAPIGNATLEVIGEYNYIVGGGTRLPEFSGVLTVKGGTIYSDNDIVFSSDTVLKDTELKIGNDYKALAFNGHNIRIESTVKKAEGSKTLNIHAGINGSDMNGDQKVEIYGGDYGVIQMGPYYIHKSILATWNGNFDFVLGGSATAGELKFGDGYGDLIGSFKMNGKANAVIEEGASLSKVNPKGYAASYDSFRVYNSGVKAVVLNGDIENRNFKLYNFIGIAPIAIDGETMTFDSPANIVGVANANTDASNVLACPEKAGAYSVTAGHNVADGLSIDGAQIRIANADVKQGLRFVAKYTDELAAKYDGKEYGFVVIPTAVLAGAPLDATKTYTYNSREFTPAIVPAKLLYAEGDGFVQYTACLTDIVLDNYKTSYTAITYIKDGDNYIYGDTYATSVYAIAKDAVEKHNDGTKPLEDDVLTVMQQIISAADAK